jgi:hypothetical protein
LWNHQQVTKAKAVAGEKVAKAAPKAKKQPLQVSSPFDSDANIVPDLVAKVSKLQISNKSIEETYQKKTQLEHILLRPDTYVGSIEKHTQALWVFEDGSMVNRNVSFVPGLYKIFDEILVNAADNKQRDPSMDTLKVKIKRPTGSSSSLLADYYKIPKCTPKFTLTFLVLFGHITYHLILS